MSGGRPVVAAGGRTVGASRSGWSDFAGTTLTRLPIDDAILGPATRLAVVGDLWTRHARRTVRGDEAV